MLGSISFLIIWAVQVLADPLSACRAKALYGPVGHGYRQWQLVAVDQGR